MKLNLGCGYKKKEGYCNVDKGDFCSPDVVCDLSQTPWPWEENSIDEVCFEFSLEQMGEKPSDLKHIIQELYRVCKTGAKIQILCFHPRHDQFFLNPLNVHRLSVEFFHMLSIQNNLQQIAAGYSDNCLGIEWGVNFSVSKFTALLTKELHDMVTQKLITEDEIRRRLKFENNLCHALEIELTTAKRGSEGTP